MTREEKAKAYDEALEKARKYRDEEGFTEMENVFPELKESEDEKIRKELIEFLDETYHLGKNTNFDRWDKSDCANWIAYLEKQKDTTSLVTIQEAYREGFSNAMEAVKQKPEEYGLQKEQETTPDWMPKFLDELRSKKNYFDWDEHRDIEGSILAIIDWIAPNYFNRKEKEQKPAERSEADEDKVAQYLHDRARTKDNKTSFFSKEHQMALLKID